MAWSLVMKLPVDQLVSATHTVKMMGHSIISTRKNMPGASQRKGMARADRKM